MLRVFEDRAPWTNFNNLPEIHHRHTMTNPLYHGHIVGDKQIRNAEITLEIEQQVDNLPANRNIQRLNGFVGNDHFWIQCQRASNADALALTAGKLMRVTPGMFR